MDSLGPLLQYRQNDSVGVVGQRLSNANASLYIHAYIYMKEAHMPHRFRGSTSIFTYVSIRLSACEQCQRCHALVITTVCLVCLVQFRACLSLNFARFGCNIEVFHTSVKRFPPPCCSVYVYPYLTSECYCPLCSIEYSQGSPSIPGPSKTNSYKRFLPFNVLAVTVL